MDGLLREIRAMKSQRSRVEILNRLPRAAVCAEIGVWKGDFSNELLLSTAPNRLHLIDPWRFRPELPKRWYGGRLAKSQVDMDGIYMSVVGRFKNIPEVVIHRMASADAARLFDDEFFDWVYVDGDHSRSAVMADLRTWWPKIKFGGQLVGDDYRWKDENGFRSVQHAVVEFVQGMKTEVELVGGTQFIIKKTAEPAACT
ncbi:MAG TPA: class I SAM-dependent methyltransferase [Rhizomicrobium sp.]|jgi:hypothetical protein|nr:class I SAM-dependent methyltransferase [Rhizomicrobium sp.]